MTVEGATDWARVDVSGRVAQLDERLGDLSSVAIGSAFQTVAIRDPDVVPPFWPTTTQFSSGNRQFSNRWVNEYGQYVTVTLSTERPLDVPQTTSMPYVISNHTHALRGRVPPMGERKESKSDAAVVQPSETTVSRRTVLRSGIAVATLGAGLSSTRRVHAGSSRGPVRQGEREPNDAKSEATRIEPGIVRGHIGPCCLSYVADEDDWLQFDVASGDDILVNFDVSPPTRARLLGPGNSVLDVEGYNPDRLSGTTQNSGTAYIHLTEPPGGANSEYAFTLELNGTGGNGGDGGAGGNDAE